VNAVRGPVTRRLIECDGITACRDRRLSSTRGRGGYTEVLRVRAHTRFNGPDQEFLTPRQHRSPSAVGGIRRWPSSAVACNGVQGATAFMVLLASLATKNPQVVDSKGAEWVRIPPSPPITPFRSIVYIDGSSLGPATWVVALPSHRRRTCVFNKLTCPVGSRRAMGIRDRLNLEETWHLAES
jgi:hypothetical protein